MANKNNKPFKAAVFQLNSLIGGFAENTKKICAAIAAAEQAGADLIIFPELAVSGYPPQDLLFNPQFIDQNSAALQKICQAATGNIGIAVGSFQLKNNTLLNQALFIANGQILLEQTKTYLANNDVFIDPRYFQANQKPLRLVEWRNIKIGLLVCEDIWHEEENMHTPATQLAQQGAQLLIVINASCFARGKALKRQAIIKGIAQKFSIPLIYANSIGGQADLIFDGGSMASDSSGVIEQGSFFKEETLYFYPFNSVAKSDKPADLKIEEEESIRQAIILALRDYLQKNGFSKVCLGLSGGIDSALTACLAVEALGSANVSALLMPSPYSSQGSIDDALALAGNLSIRTATISIEKPLAALKAALQPIMDTEGVVEENLQARLRGILLMAYSNKHNSLLLTTGNKSELAVGYGTLYGDMCGGFNPIGDLYKTQIYSLCKHINRQKGQSVIPESILTKEPSAELKAGQKDSDSLPPYPMLDAILTGIVEKNQDIEQLAAAGLSKEAAIEAFKLIRASEFKRFQAPPVAKLSEKSFGSGRLMPLARALFETRTKL